MTPKELEIRKAAESNPFFEPKCLKCNYHETYKDSTFRWHCGSCVCGYVIDVNKIKVIKIDTTPSFLFHKILNHSKIHYQSNSLKIRIYTKLYRLNEKINIPSQQS